METKLLTINKYSRPGTKLNGVKGIVIHYVGNAGSSASANRNYFDNLKNGTNGVYASAHYIIGLQGEVIQCIPNDEMAYHVGAKTYKNAAVKNLSSYPNDCTLGIECCHADSTGKPNEATYKSLVQVIKDLCKQYGLNPSKDIYRHYDITGKDCHRYYVNNTVAWEQLKKDVTEPDVDQVHKNNVDILVKAGVIGSPDAWYTLNQINVNNVKALISKVAAKLK